MRAPAIAVLVGLLGLAACDDFKPSDRSDAKGPDAEGRGAAASAFRYSATGDMSGVYVPDRPTQVGRLSLDRLYIGQGGAFEAWAASGAAGSAPIQLSFGGSEARPTRYSLSDADLSFEGVAPGVEGKVLLRVRIDQGALATAKRNLGDDGVVMTGTITAAGQSVPVALRWYGGD